MGKYVKRVITAALLAASIIALYYGCSTATEPETKRGSYFEVSRVYYFPGRGLEDLVYYNDSLWVTDSDRDGTIYRISVSDGDVMSKTQPDFGVPGSIMSDDDRLYVAEKYGGGIHRISANNRMDTLEDYDCGLTEIRGLYTYGGNRYAFDNAESVVFTLDENFAVTGLLPINQGPRKLYGFGEAGGKLWTADSARGWICVLNDDLEVTEEYVTGCEHPRGVAWDGQYLYIGNAAGRRIYQLNIN